VNPTGCGRTTARTTFPGSSRRKEDTVNDDVPTRELVERARKGDADAWNALTGRYTNLLWSIARSLRLSEADAADAVQSTWLRAVENLDGIREPERLGSWLATSMRRECYDAHRRAARVRVGAPGRTDDWEALPDPTDPLDAALLRDERDAGLWRAVGRLKPHCQQLLRVLVADPPPSYAEAAAALDMPVGSVGPTRQRCLRCLRDLLAGAELNETDGGAGQ
jgi:RNA polymerase sigma factor (sigma-70 family)